MHDAAPVHYSRVVSDYLNTFCPDGRAVRNTLEKSEIHIMCRRNIIFTVEGICDTWYLTILSSAVML
jgi:hypothetical protein